MEREERLRRRDERDRLRRAQETDVQEKQAQVNNSGVLFCIGALRRMLARRRERDRVRRTATTTEERDSARHLRGETRCNYLRIDATRTTTNARKSAGATGHEPSCRGQ